MVAGYVSLGVRYYGYQEQEDGIFDYSMQYGLRVEEELIEEVKLSDAIEERKELHTFFQKMAEGDQFLVYSLDAFSNDTLALTKILYCLFKRGVEIHLCKDEIVIHRNTPAMIIMNLLDDVRERRNDKQATTGRPKGSKSRSRFDELRGEIIVMLNNGLSISEIAREVDVSRSSLKDYINSRNLKEMAKRWELFGKYSFILNKEVMEERYRSVMEKKVCKLVAEAAS